MFIDFLVIALGLLGYMSNLSQFTFKWHHTISRKYKNLTTVYFGFPSHSQLDFNFLKFGGKKTTFRFFLFPCSLSSNSSGDFSKADFFLGDVLKGLKIK